MRMGQRKCVCAIKCGRNASKQSRRQQQQRSNRHAIGQQQNNHVEEIINSHNPIVEMITTRARLCNDQQQKNEKIIAIVDSTMHDCKSLKGSNGNCTNHHREQYQGHQHHQHQQHHHRPQQQQQSNALDGINARHKHKNGHGLNSTLEDRIRLKFFGYDMPYPPVDFAVISMF